MKHKNKLKLREALLNTEKPIEIKRLIASLEWSRHTPKSAINMMSRVLTGKNDASHNLVYLFSKHCNVTLDFLYSNYK
jgi:hypothetical protein